MPTSYLLNEILSFIAEDYFRTQEKFKLSEAKQYGKKVLSFILSIFLVFYGGSAKYIFAREGDSGYEGGISSGEAPGKTSFEYKEVCFITGEPIALRNCHD